MNLFFEGAEGGGILQYFTVHIYVRGHKGVMLFGTGEGGGSLHRPRAGGGDMWVLQEGKAHVWRR